MYISAMSQTQIALDWQLKKKKVHSGVSFIDWLILKACRPLLDILRQEVREAHSLYVDIYIFYLFFFLIY